MKYFIVADVHGFYNEMMTALNEAGFDSSNPEHIFCSLGDAFDRGPQPREALQFMLSLNPERRILIRGNHEDLMEQAITRQSFYEYDISNGTKDTMFALTDAKNSFDAFDRMRTLPIYNEYIANCIDYYETENAIFVHGWIPCDKYRKGFYPIIYHYDYWKDWRNAQKYEWEDARWLNGMECWDNRVREPHKTIFCGHWHTEWAREIIDKTCVFHTSRPEDFKPWIRDGIVALDACTAYTHFVNCYVWEE